MLLGHPEGARSGIEGPMAQEHLDRPDIDARFEEMGRKTMAERMDAVAVSIYSRRAVRSADGRE